MKLKILSVSLATERGRKYSVEKIDLNNSKIYLQKVFSDNSGNLFVSTTRGIFKSKIKKFCSFKFYQSQ